MFSQTSIHHSTKKRFYVFGEEDERCSGILGKNRISIAAVTQKGRQVRDAVPMVMMTHEARGRDIIRALEEIDRLPVILDSTVRIWVENRLS